METFYGEKPVCLDYLQDPEFIKNEAEYSELMSVSRILTRGKNVPFDEQKAESDRKWQLIEESNKIFTKYNPTK